LCASFLLWCFSCSSFSLLPVVSRFSLAFFISSIGILNSSSYHLFLTGSVLVVKIHFNIILSQHQSSLIYCLCPVHVFPFQLIHPAHGLCYLSTLVLVTLLFCLQN
jgi:hypothetical protein